MVDLFIPFRIKLPAFIILPSGSPRISWEGLIPSGVLVRTGILGPCGRVCSWIRCLQISSLWDSGSKRETRICGSDFVTAIWRIWGGIEATKKLLESDPENPELHLNLARAESRWRSFPRERAYEKAIRLCLEKTLKRLRKFLIEYWKKYFSILEPSCQVRLSLALSKMSNVNLAALSLQTLVDSGHPLDIYMEQAHLNLAKIYWSGAWQGRPGPTYLWEFLQKFPGSNIGICRKNASF